MTDIANVLIFILGITAYSSAVYQMVKGDYSPSFFSRGVWFLLGIISFSGVLFGEANTSAVILAGTLLIGNTAVFIVSYKIGSREFGLVEKLCLGLLATSCIAWAVSNSAFVGLSLSLFAHLVGGIPTIWRVLKNPDTEKAYHWYFYFTACLLTLAVTEDWSIYVILYPLYFAIFDGLIIALANRRRLLQLIK